MYELISITNTTILHDNYNSYNNEFLNDFPEWPAFLSNKLFNTNVLRRDMEWLTESNSLQITLLFESLSECLDYIRETWIEAFGLDISKTKYNDIQFRDYMLNTEVNLLDGKYKINIISLRQII